MIKVNLTIEIPLPDDQIKLLTEIYNSIDNNMIPKYPYHDKEIIALENKQLISRSKINNEYDFCCLTPIGIAAIKKILGESN